MSAGFATQIHIIQVYCLMMDSFAVKYEQNNKVLTLRHQGALRHSVAVCMLTAIFVSMLFLVSCAPKSPEMVLEESVVSELDLIASADSSTIGEFSDYMDISELDQFGIDAYEFGTAYFKGFDYRIDDIDVTENAARVEVTLTMKDYPTFQSKLEKAVDRLNLDNKRKNYSNERFKELYGNAVMAALNETPDTKRNPITITYRRDGNAWISDQDIFFLVMSEVVNAE